jgi:hypothetical protein
MPRCRTLLSPHVLLPDSTPGSAALVAKTTVLHDNVDACCLWAPHLPPQVRPLQPRPIPFDKQLGRPELHPNSSPQPTSDYKDVPLTVLAGNRRVLGVLKFGKGNTQPPAQVAEVVSDVIRRC